jgi:nucleotide-binding universal stress UspA family protein
MKTILVPTDFSENALRALEVAIGIAKKTGASIVAFNAYDIPYSQNVMTTSLLEIMKENSESGMKDIYSRLEESGIAFRVESRLGNPIRAVKELAKKESADLVVLGTKGASGIEEILIGSNAASILHAVDCPVLAIPANGTIDDWKTIIYACDLNNNGEIEALTQLKSIAKTFGSTVSIVHVQDKDDKELHVINRYHYEKYLLGIELSFHVLDDIGGVEKTILKFAQEQNADLLALLARRYGFLQGMFHKSMTSQIAYHSRLPFLTLHEG